MYNLHHADLGFPSERLLLVRLDLREAATDAARRHRVVRELAGQFQRIPGVRAVSFSHLGVFSGGNSVESIQVEGYTAKGDNDRASGLDAVGPGYFSALGVPILLGREIAEMEGPEAPRVCVINEAFAKRFFDQRNPIGLHITSISDDNKGTSYTIVGVAKNARTQALRGEVATRYYVAAGQPPSSSSSPTFLIRTASDSAAVLTAVRRTVERVDAALPIISAKTIEEQMARLTAQDRSTAQLAVVFGCVALMLAAIGLYGVLSYGISRRSGEIAIRIALGAEPGRVVRMILGETAGLVSGGLVMGGGLAYAATLLIDSRLYGVAPQDPSNLVVATALLLIVALSAAYLPAQRVSRMQPLAALRQE